MKKKKHMSAMANENYIQYLELKEKIQELNLRLSASPQFLFDDARKEYERKLEATMEEMEKVIDNLDFVFGITPKDLLLLSLGVHVFEQTS